LNFDLFEKFFSKSRLSTYLNESNRQEDIAIKLYTWNIEICGAIYESQAIFETALRNSINTQLRRLNFKEVKNELCTQQPNEYLIKIGIENRINDAKKRFYSNSKNGRQITHDDILSQMTLGTWSLFVPSKNENKQKLWVLAISDAFPFLRNEDAPKITRSIRNIQLIRNRVAHLEPVLWGNKIRDLYKEISFVLNAIDPKLSEWYVSRQRITQVLKKRPYPTFQKEERL
jgi:hypothetical protein